MVALLHQYTLEAPLPHTYFIMFSVSFIACVWDIQCPTFSVCIFHLIHHDIVWRCLNEPPPEHGAKNNFLLSCALSFKGTVSPEIVFYFRVYKSKSVLLVRLLLVFKFVYFVVL